MMILLMMLLVLSCYKTLSFQIKSKIISKNRLFKRNMCIDRDLQNMPMDSNQNNINTSPGRNIDSWRTSSSSSTIIPVDLDKITIRPELITLDAFGTLIYPSQSIGRWYREALNVQCNMQIRLPRPALFTAAFNKVYSDMSKRYPCFGALEKNEKIMTSKDWWYQVVDQTYRSTTGISNTIDSNELSLLIPNAFEVLYNDVFNTKKGWIVKEDAKYTLDRLQLWRDQGDGPKLGIISNFDPRLNNILLELDLLKYFDDVGDKNLILNSYDTKSEKPSIEMFQNAMLLANVKDPSKCFHVGDNINKDILGASNAGWTPMRFNEWFDNDFPDWESIETIEEAESGAKNRSILMQWGRKDIKTGLQWYELWGLDDILTLFGFPEDEEKSIRTTYIRNYRDDY